MEKEFVGSGGIRTHASEETGALNQRLRPLGHATLSWHKVFEAIPCWTHQFSSDHWS